MTRRHLGAAAVLASTLLIAACGQTDDGDATPEGQEPPTSDTLEASDVEVQNPKDLSTASDPCTLLTPEQLSSFGLQGESPEKDTAPWGGPQCNWESTGIGFTLSPNTTESGSFTNIRSNQENFANFNEFETEGYPAARYNSNERTCDVVIATNQDHSLVVNAGIYSTQDTEFDDPCELAEKIGIEALGNVQGQN